MEPTLNLNFHTIISLSWDGRQCLQRIQFLFDFSFGAPFQIQRQIVGHNSSPVMMRLIIVGPSATFQIIPFANSTCRFCKRFRSESSIDLLHTQNTNLIVFCQSIRAVEIVCYLPNANRQLAKIYPYFIRYKQTYNMGYTSFASKWCIIMRTSIPYFF